MDIQIISRTTAAEQGRKRFYTGKPCKYGHDSQRFVSTGGCIKCNAVRSASFSNGVRVVSSSARAGHFVYSLHPDDHAAALAYCQALDLARGIVPKVPTATPGGMRHAQQQPVDIVPASVGYVPGVHDRGGIPMPVLPPTDAASEQARAVLAAKLSAQPPAYIPEP